MPLRRNKDFPMALYVAHRLIFSKSLLSRPCELYDINEVELFLRKLTHAQLALKDLSDSLDPAAITHSKAILFECDDSIIGLAIVR